MRFICFPYITFLVLFLQKKKNVQIEITRMFRVVSCRFDVSKYWPYPVVWMKKN